MDKVLIKETVEQEAILDIIEDEHRQSLFNTPIRADAFEMSDDLKMSLIETHFAEIMRVLGLDLTDDSLKDTPKRVAKMYVKEMFSGLNPVISRP